MRTRKMLGQLRMIAMLVLCLALTGALPASAQETIDATAQGTSTQLGKTVGVKLIISSWSTKEDRKTLDDAFKNGQNQGLVQALEKMKPVGRIQIPGTLGYDVAYAISIPTTTGRTVRFAKPTRTLSRRLTTSPEARSTSLTRTIRRAVVFSTLRRNW